MRKNCIELSDFIRKCRGKDSLSKRMTFNKVWMKFPEKNDNVKFSDFIYRGINRPIHHLGDEILYKHKIHNPRFL